MSIILFILLAAIFGWAFSELSLREVKKLDQRLEKERKGREVECELYIRDQRKLKNTIRELL